MELAHVAVKLLPALSIVLVFSSSPAIAGDDAGRVDSYKTTHVINTEAGLVAFGSPPSRPLWRALEDQSPTEPARLGNSIIVGAGNTVHRLSMDDGSSLWQHAADGRVFAPALAEGLVVIGTETGSVQALDPHDGRLIWESRFDGWIYTPAVAGDRVVVAGQERKVHAVSLHDGSRLWSTPLPNEAVYRPVWSREAGIVVTTFSGHVLALAPDSGMVRWSVTTGVPQFSPLVTRHALVFRGLDGRVTARSPSDGAAKWTWAASPASGPLTGSDTHIAFLDDTGVVHLLDAADGTEARRLTLADASTERIWMTDTHIAAVSRDRLGKGFGKPRVQRWPIKPPRE